MTTLEPSKRCPARSKRTGEQCGQWAGAGTPYSAPGSLCKWHGGLSPGSLKRSARLKLEAELAQRTTLGAGEARPHVDPIEAMLIEVARASAAVAWLDAVVGAADFGELLATGSTEADQAVRLWERQRELLRKACESAVRAGVSERRVVIEEERGRMVVEVINRILADNRIALTPQQRAIAPRVARDHLLTVPIRGEGEVEDAEIIEDDERDNL